MTKNYFIKLMISVLTLGFLTLVFTEGVAADAIIPGSSSNAVGTGAVRLLKPKKNSKSTKSTKGPKNTEKADLKQCDADLQKCEDANPIIVPTAPLLESISMEATNLTEVGCDKTGDFQCDETQWVYCIDASCAEPDEYGISKCDCILQSPSASRLPP